MGFRSWFFSKVYADNKKVKRYIGDTNNKIDELNKKYFLLSEHFNSINYHTNEHIQKLTENNKLLHENILNLIQTVNLISANRDINESQKITCLFLVHNIESWDSIFSIYKLMLSNKKFHVIVASINRRYPGSQVFKDEDYMFTPF